MTFHTSARKSLIAVATAALATACLIAPRVTASAAGTTLAMDTMSQDSASSGWGWANAGGAYTASPADAGSVSGGAATLTSPGSGQTAVMTLKSVRAQDAISHIDFSLPALPSGSAKVYVTHFLRGTDRTSYAAQVMVTADGSSLLTLERINSGVETTLVNVDGPAVEAGRQMTVELSTVGTSPVRLGAKIWAAADSEPATWTALASDSSADRVTAAGPTGVTVYASRAGGVTPVRFDNLLTRETTAPASDPVAAPPATTPTPVPTQTATPSPTRTPTSTPTQTLAPTPTRTTTAAPTTAAPTTTVPVASAPSTGTSYAGQRLQAGAALPGSQSYAVPADAKYVSLSGSDSNAGTVDKPFRTISAATKAAKDGGTVVVRAGVYHEDVLVYPHDSLTVEAYPGEAVWLDGSEPVSGWTRSGSVWVRSGWSTFFDSSPTYTKGAPDGTTENWQWIDPDYPMASHPDQIWVNGRALTQVASRDAVTDGTFYVDQSALQLVMGSDPTGKLVEASTLAEAMSVRSQNSVIRGFGVRRYADSVPMMGAVTTYFPGVTLDNMTIVDNAATGLFIGAANATVKNVTVRNNGLLGLDANEADGLTVSSVLSQGNDSQHFNIAPVSGAMKITTSSDVTVRDSSFIGNYGQGPWFDGSCGDVTFVHNDISGNSGNGLVIELSEHAVAADNVISNNGMDGLAVMDSGNVAVWNNTISGNGGGIGITQDDRRGSDPAFPWITRNTTLANNVVSQSTGEYVMRTADWSREFTGTQMVTSSEGNLFHRASAAAPTYVVVWSAKAGAGTTPYSSLEAYQSATGRDQTSTSVTGTSPLTSSLLLTSTYASRAAAAQPIPASITAAVPQLPQNAQILGATAR